VSVSDHHPATSAEEVGNLRHEELSASEQPPHRGFLAAAWSAVTALVGGPDLVRILRQVRGPV